MSLSKNINAIKLSALLLLAAAANSSVAQSTTVCKNQYPCGECAVFDNNGNDLKGFIYNNKKQLDVRGGKLNEASDNMWGYLLIRTAKVPSVSSKWEKKGDLNVTASIRTTYVMNKTKDGEQATWWARECNLNNGPLVQIKVNDEDKLDMEHVRYEKLMHSLDPMKFTLVEYADTFNDRDYDFMLKNYILTKCRTVDVDDYKSMVDFYNGFLGKFTTTDDAALGNSSFLTFFTGTSNAKYLGYFNVVNGKLAGKLEALDIQYERDRDTVIKHTFTKLTGKTVYIYGDDTYGMDKKMILYGKAHDLKLRRRKTNITSKFNNER